MDTKLSIESVKNNLVNDIEKAIAMSKDTSSIDVLHIMKDLIHNNLKEVKCGARNKDIINYFKDTE